MEHKLVFGQMLINSYITCKKANLSHHHTYHHPLHQINTKQSTTSRYLIHHHSPNMLQNLFITSISITQYLVINGEAPDAEVDQVMKHAQADITYSRT